MESSMEMAYSLIQRSGKQSCIKTVADRFNMLRSTLVQHTGYKSSLFPNA